MIDILGDLILKVELDISEENLFMSSITFKLIIFIIMHFILLYIIFYFTSKYQSIQNKLHLENKKNEELANYNKNFISNMVHQIRTPLSIIMTNISFIELASNSNISKYSEHINAAINLLSNSYENISYYISYKEFEYSRKEINISDFLSNRILFFDHIASAYGKKILNNTQQNIIYKFNDIELERLIDNNIFMAIKYSEYNTNINISLRKLDDLYILKLTATKKNNKSTFKIENIDKKQTLDTQLTQLIIDRISTKYNIKYYRNNNTFKYVWN
jgi:signal transduction histidine kinase